MLQQKSAIVTGSTSGIGLGIARAFAEQGADILLNGFGDAHEIEFTRAELQRQYGVKVRYSSADMSRPEQVRAMADEVCGEWVEVPDAQAEGAARATLVVHCRAQGGWLLFRTTTRLRMFRDYMPMVLEAMR